MSLFYQSNPVQYFIGVALMASGVVVVIASTNIPEDLGF
jgi:energy-converting hydrogenase Eha subunit C